MSASPGAAGPRALVLSVGGSPEPVLASIERQRPQALVFFVSRESRAMLEGSIIGKLPEGYRPSWDVIETPSAELLDESYRSLVDELPGIVARRALSWSELRADFTGGTKVMSAALVLALVDRGCDFSYIGGVDELAREKGGLGVVLGGKERLFLTGDPWASVAEGRLREASRLFAAGRLDAAVAALPEPPPRGRTGVLVRSLRPLFEGFLEWDLQRYPGAARKLDKGLEGWEAFAEGSRNSPALRYLETLRAVRARLERLNAELSALAGFRPGAPPPQGIDALAIPADLCAAAVRRVRMQGDAEDGVLLLYAAMEKLAKGRLIAQYGLDNSCLPQADLGPLQERYAGRLRNGAAQLPLEDSFELLAARGDEVGLRFRSRLTDVRKLQVARNGCWREHGYKQVESRAFEALLPRVLEFVGVREEELTRFPAPEAL